MGYFGNRSIAKSLRPKPKNNGCGIICQRSLSNGRDDSHNNNNNNNQHSSDDTNTKVLDLDPRLTEWIPPSRPLVGDKGFSHLYRDFGSEKEESEEDELARIELELQALEMQEQDSGYTRKEAELTGTERKLRALEDAEGDEEEDEEELTQEEKDYLQQLEAGGWEVMDDDENLPEGEDDEEEENDEEPLPSLPVAPQPNVDWQQTRRERLGKDARTAGLSPSFDKPYSDLPVERHTLFTADEIMGYLSSLGGANPNLVLDKVWNDFGDTRLGGALKGLIFVTGHSPAHVRMLSTSLVEQLKRRKLQEVGVMGAKYGAEGSKDGDETWFCIDCHNYAVNIQTEETRRVLDLEGWWSVGNPLAGYGLDTGGDDDDAMDEFVARNPAPREYGRTSMVDYDASVHELESRRWTAPHKVVVTRRPKGGKGRDKKKKNQSRRYR
jgi:ribosomal silencing factor RsfS